MKERVRRCGLGASAGRAGRVPVVTRAHGAGVPGRRRLAPVAELRARGHLGAHAADVPALEQVLGDVGTGGGQILPDDHGDRLERTLGLHRSDALTHTGVERRRVLAQQLREPLLGTVEVGSAAGNFVLAKRTRGHHDPHSSRTAVDVLLLP